jgi:hypothetical protein
MMKFSPANNKLAKLASVKAMKPFLKNGRKIYSFDILSGGKHCPYSKLCSSQAVEQPDGSLKIVDGPHTLFRCYSASQEALFKNVYKRRKENSHILYLAAQDYKIAANELEKALPKNAGIIRCHSGGEFSTKAYMKAWLELARRRPDLLIYCYTKSIPFLLALKSEIDNLPNFIYTCSFGGYKDNLIVQHNLRSVRVVNSVYEARKLKLPIDKNDSFAADPAKRNISYALLIHGQQPRNSLAGKAVKKLKGKGSYGK